MSVLRASNGTEASGEKLMVEVRGSVVTPGTVTTGVMTTSESGINWFVTGRRVLKVTVVTPASVTAVATIKLNGVATTPGSGTIVSRVQLGTPGMVAIAATSTTESAVCRTPEKGAGTIDSMVNVVTLEAMATVLGTRRLDTGAYVGSVAAEGGEVSTS